MKTLSLRAVVACVTAAALASAAACSSDATGPEPPPVEQTATAFTASLVTPNADDGAVQFLVSGAPVDSVTTSQAFAFTGAAGSATRVIVAGHLAAGSIATVWVSTPTLASKLSATVEQVAQRGTFAERTTTGYSVALTAK